MGHKGKAISALIVTIILWSSAFVGIRYTMKFYSAGGLALFRYFVASLVLVYPFMKIENKRLPSLKEMLGFFLLGVLGFSIYNVALNYGELTVNAGIANFIVSQVPLLVSIIAAVVFKEKVSRMGWFGLLVSVLGVFLIMIGESDGKIDVGVFFIFIATISMAIYVSLQKTYLKRYHPIEITAYAIWGGTLALLIYTPSAINEISRSDWKHILTVVYMGIFPGAIAYCLWCYGFKYIAAAQASSFLYLAPIFTLFFAWLFLSEKPHIIAVTGGFIALMGSLIINTYRFSSAK